MALWRHRPEQWFQGIWTLDSAMLRTPSIWGSLEAQGNIVPPRDTSLPTPGAGLRRPPAQCGGTEAYQNAHEHRDTDLDRQEFLRGAAEQLNSLKPFVRG